MESEELINALRLLNGGSNKNFGQFTQPLPELVKNIYTNTHLIGILSRTADEDSKRYEQMLEYAEELLSMIDVELKN